MSGLIGHLNHLYDDRSLTLRDIKTIFAGLAENSIAAEEKLDGINCFWSADGLGRVRFARNKTHLKTGGLTLEQIQRGDYASGLIKETYIRVIESLQAVVDKLSLIERKTFFNRCFYNAEIIGEHSKRIIPYEKNVISIHRTGHIAENKPNVQFLEQFAGRLNYFDGFPYEFALTPSVKVKSFTLNFENLTKIFKNNDKMTVSEVIDIQNGLKTLKREIVRLSSTLLERTNSAFVGNFDAALTKIKDNYNETLKIIRSNAQYKQQIEEFLTEQDYQSIAPNSTVEGIIFEYNNKPYKLTGHFAAMNQVMGLYEFGRGSIPALKSKPFDFAIFPGSFRPPHKGHMDVIKRVVSEAAQTLVFLSKTNRKSNDGAEVDIEISKAIFNLYLTDAKLNDKVRIHRSDGQSPVREVYSYINESLPKGSRVLVISGNKEKDIERFATIHQYVKNCRVEVMNFEPVVETRLGVMNSTKMREAINDIESLKKYLPTESIHNALKIQNILKDAPLISDADIVSMVTEHIIKQGGEFALKKTQESSAMGGAAVEGRAGSWSHDEPDGYPSPKPTPKPDAKLKRKTHKQLADAKIFRENMIEEIQDILAIHEADDSDIPRSSTAINVLEDLLKQILPAIKDGYKDLTTSQDQRISFRAHLINAIENAIKTAGMDEPGETAPTADEGPPMEGLKEDIEIDVAANPDLAKLTGLDGADSDIPELIDLDSDGAEADERATFARGLEKHQLDLTGRNMAFEAFNGVEQSILDAYDLLGSPEDKDTFVQYLISNIKLYFARWEDELAFIV